MVTVLVEILDNCWSLHYCWQ